MNHDADDLFSQRMAHLGELIEAVESSAPKAAVEPARDLLRAALDVHESGLRAMLDVLRSASGEGANKLLRAMCDDASVASLLVLHGLHPDSLETRITHAITLAQSGMRGGAKASVVMLDAERALVRLEGDPAAAGALRLSLERLLSSHAPDAQIEIRGGDNALPRDIIPLSRLVTRSETGA